MIAKFTAGNQIQMKVNRAEIAKSISDSLSNSNDIAALVRNAVNSYIPNQGKTDAKGNIIENTTQKELKGRKIDKDTVVSLCEIKYDITQKNGDVDYNPHLTATFIKPPSATLIEIFESLGITFENEADNLR